MNNDVYQSNTAQNQDSWTKRNESWITPLISVVGGYAANREIQKQNQEFNALEAEKQRNWEKMMSDTSYQRGYADLLKAGLNPNLAGGSGGASTPTGANAASANAPYMDYGSLANVALTSSQIDNMNADTNLKDEQAGVSKSQRILNQTENKLKPIIAEAQIKLNNATSEREKATAKKEMEIAVQEAINSAWMQIYGHKPGEKVQNGLAAMVQKMIAIGAGADTIVQKTINRVREKQIR